MAFYLLLSPLIFHSEYFLGSLYSQSHVFSALSQSQIVFPSVPVSKPSSAAKHKLPSSYINWFQLALAGDPSCLQEPSTERAAALPDTLQLLVCRARLSEAAPQPRQGKHSQGKHFLQALQHCSYLPVDNAEIPSSSYYQIS